MKTVAERFRFRSLQNADSSRTSGRQINFPIAVKVTANYIPRVRARDQRRRECPVTIAEENEQRTGSAVVFEEPPLRPRQFSCLR